MPGMDGYEVCRRLKEDAVTRDIPIMFITAQNEETDEATGLSLGAQDYVIKPFRASLVRNRVANQLRYKRYRDHLNDLVRERTRQLSLTQEATIIAMASLAEWRDTETGAHIRRTQNYVKALAKHMSGLPTMRRSWMPTPSSGCIFQLRCTTWARWPLPTPYCTSRAPLPMKNMKP